MGSDKVELRCDECAFYAKKGVDAGQCRKRAPLSGMHWTIVNADDWCGEFQTPALFQLLSRMGRPK